LHLVITRVDTSSFSSYFSATLSWF